MCKAKFYRAGLVQRLRGMFNLDRHPMKIRTGRSTGIRWLALGGLIGGLAAGSAQLPTNFVVTVSKSGGGSVELNLTRYSIRSTDFRVVSWNNADGYVVEHSPTNDVMPVRTYRGYVTQAPNELVTAIIDVDNTLDATIHNGSGRLWTVSNVDVSGLLGGGPPPALPTTGVPLLNTPPPSGSGSQAPPGDYMPPVNLYSVHGVYDIPSSQYKGSVDASLAWLEYQWNIHDFFNSRDGKLNILLTEVFVRKEQFYFPANGNWSQFNGMLHTEWLARGINTRGFIGSAFPNGFSYAGGYAVGNNFYNTGSEAICINALYHENAHNWGAQHYYYGVDTMSGSYPAHGEMNVARVLNNRNREIGEGGPVLTTNAVSLMHPYGYPDLVTTLAGSPVDIAPLANDWDANGEPLSIKYFTANTVQGGTVTQFGNVLTYTPAPGYVGKDIVVYEVQDSSGLFTQELIHIEVVNHGLAAHWDFEETSGQTAADSSGHGHAGTLSGASFGSDSVPGPVGRALSLAAGEHMVCDDTDLIAEPEDAYPLEVRASNFFDPMDESFSLACWFKLDDPSQTATLFTKRNPGYFGYIVTANSSGVATTVRPWDGNGPWYTVSGGAIHPDSWYHAVMVINRADHTLRLYVNGVEVGTAASLPSDKFIFNGREDLWMGGGGPVKLDDARIYTKPLTPAEIASIYAIGTPPAGLPSPANDAFNVAHHTSLSWFSHSVSNEHDVYFGADPVAVAAATTNSVLYRGRVAGMTLDPGQLGVANTYYWRVDVVPPTGPVVPGDLWRFTTADSSLAGELRVHLTLDDADLAGLSLDTVQDIAPVADNFTRLFANSGQPGPIGEAFEFNGTNSLVWSLEADLISTSPGGTLSLWMKSTSGASGRYLLNIEGAWVLQYQAGGVIAFLDGSSSGNPTLGSGLNDGQWHHVLAANDGSTTSVYVDGSLQSSYPETIFDLNSLSGRKTAVGAHYEGEANFFEGSIDDVAIWARGLNAAEAKLVYDNGLAGRSVEREPMLVRTSFESVEGFTGYSSPNFAALGTKVNVADGSVWSGVGGDVQIWNRADIPPDGVQCLKLGDVDGQCLVQIPGTNHGVGLVRLDYASYSSSTDSDLSLSYSNATSGGWVQVWSTHLTGNNPAWETKPWPTVTIPVNAAGDVRLLLQETGSKGILVDNFRVTGKSNYPPVFVTSPLVKSDGTTGVAYADTLRGDAYDPSAFDTLTFSKQGGPAWLHVADDGTLSGTPGGADVGTNSFSVQVTDLTGQSSDATLLINVQVTSASLMAGDLPNSGYTGFWSWLAADNPDSPNGIGADVDGAVVTRWDDVRGSMDHDLARNSGGGGGIFHVNVINGLPAIQYTGTRNNWGAYGTAGEFQTLANGYTLFVVARVNALAAAGYLFDGSSGNGRVSLRAVTGTPARWQLHAVRSFNGPAINTIANTAEVTLNQFEVHAVQVSGTTMTHYVNGALGGAASFNDGGTPLPMSGLILSCDSAVGNHLECDVAEVLAYSEVLNTTDRNAVEEYLLSKYGLAQPPPEAPTILQVGLIEGGMSILVGTQSGYQYVLETATNLVPPVVWTPVSTNAGTGGILEFTPPVMPGQPQGFFRTVAH